MQSFFITGLPRSRTKWFSEYFSAAGAPCIHDPVGYCSREDVYELVEAGIGISDSGLWVTDLVSKYPEVPVVVIERNVTESLYALEAIGIPWSPYIVRALNPVVGSLRVAYRNINEQLEEIHRFCTDRPYRKELADMMKDKVIKQDSFSVPEGQIERWL